MEPALQVDYPQGLIGHVVEGRYRIDAVIAQGGMGTVFRAEHLTLKRPVALKILRPDLETDQTRRFLREANFIAQLEHRNCVTVFDHGTSADGLHFISMQLLKGHTLSQETGTPMEEQRALRMVLDVLRGLAHAHSKGVVHRDLKPANLFVTTDDDGHEIVKLLDFGIAKKVDPNAGEEAMTLSGLMSGTPAYMAPEQVIGADTDERTDLYAVGVILFELLTGSAPWDTDDPVVLLHHQLNDSIPLLPPELSHLDPVIQQMCQKERAGRYSSAVEAMAAIEEGVDGSGDGLLATSRIGDSRTNSLRIRTTGATQITRSDESGLTVVTPPRNMHWRWLGAAGLLLLVGGIAWPALRSGGDGATASSAQAAAAVVEQIQQDESIDADIKEAFKPGATDDRLLGLLAKINDAQSPLGYAARQQGLAILQESRYGANIDQTVQTGLDLVQAGDAPQPCHTFRTALDRIEADPSGAYEGYLADATVPTPGEGEDEEACAPLGTRVAALRGDTAQDSAVAVAAPTRRRAASSSSNRSSRSKRGSVRKEAEAEVPVPEVVPTPAPAPERVDPEQKPSPAPKPKTATKPTKLGGGPGKSDKGGGKIKKLSNDIKGL